MTTKIERALSEAVLFARSQTRAQVVAYFITFGLFHIVEQRTGDPAEVDEWVQDNVAGLFDRTPPNLVWMGEPLWGFTDADDALAFRMRFG